ncbi:MAG TPA: VanZ family protein [Candidatus Hydrogenedentes bacterium]|nr:VanZ family protein [Candidatus Hydrogenedentota bacterium]
MKWPYVILIVAYCGGIFWMSSQPRTPEFTRKFEHEDKLLHAAVFAGLACIVSMGTRYSNRRFSARWQFWFPVIFAGLYGVSDEVHQAFVPHRYAAVDDVLADTAGALFVQWLLCFRIWPRQATGGGDEG